MLMPSIFGEGLLDDWMMDFPMRMVEEPQRRLYGKHAAQLMKTDVRETETGYELDIDLPGFKKENVKVHLEKGYLTISAEKGLEKDEQSGEEKQKGRYIRRERYTGSMSRSFFVGEHVRQEDIRARFEDGILRLTFPKTDPKAIEQKKYIAIE